MIKIIKKSIKAIGIKGFLLAIILTPLVFTLALIQVMSEGLANILDHTINRICSLTDK